MKISGKYERPECQKARPKLGGALPSDNRGWNGGLLSEGYGRETFTPIVERQQP